MCALEEKLKVDGIMSPDYKRFVDDTLDLAADVTSAKAFHQLYRIACISPLNLRCKYKLTTNFPFWVYC